MQAFAFHSILFCEERTTCWVENNSPISKQQLIDWLVHLCPPITRKRRCAMLWTNPLPLRSWPFSKLSCWRFDFFPRKFAACSNPPSRYNYRKASYPRTQQRDQGAGWTHDPAIRVVVKTTPLPIRPRRCQVAIYIIIALIFKNNVEKKKKTKLHVYFLEKVIRDFCSRVTYGGSLTIKIFCLGWIWVRINELNGNFWWNKAFLFGKHLLSVLY